MHEKTRYLSRVPLRLSTASVSHFRCFCLVSFLLIVCYGVFSCSCGYFFQSLFQPTQMTFDIRFSKSTSYSSLGSPSCCLIWTSFAHSIIVQNFPNKATFTTKLDRYDRVFVCRQISPIFLSQCGSFGN